MNDAIRWMIRNAQTEKLADGTVTHVFVGRIKPHMKREIQESANKQRIQNRSTVYSANGDWYGWSASFGALKSTQYNVRFVFNDYSIPMRNLI